MRSIAALALLAIVIAFTGTAHAISLNPRGFGQALIFPYYTTNKGQDTLVSVTNESDSGSMALIRFSEGMNGRYVRDFSVFLAPHDVWTARISASDATGTPTLYTADSSCTYPPVGNGQAFLASSYAGGSIFPPDGGPVGAFRTREGFFEVYEMGTVIPDSPLDHEIRRLDGQSTPTCGAPQSSPSISGEYLSPPDGRLSGSVAIVNVGEGTFFSYAAQALAGFTAQQLCCSLEYLFSTGPRMTNSAHSRYPGGAIAHVQIDDHDIALDFDQGLDAFSAVFMADSVANDYLVAAGLGANTDWVLTLPTKAFYTDPYYLSFSPPSPPVARPPFVRTFQAPGAANVLVNGTQYDQEEGHAATSALTLPWVVNVVSFQPGDDDVSGVLGSALAVPIAPFADAGTMTLDLARGGNETHTITAPDGRVLHGLPAAGFMVYNIINANAAPGKLANYGGTFPYRSTVSCTTPASHTTPCE